MRASRKEQAMTQDTPITKEEIEAITHRFHKTRYTKNFSLTPREAAGLIDAAIKGVEPSQDGAGDGKGEMSVQSHLKRADAWCRELWAANSLTLHMCDGTVKTGLSGLLRDIRDDVRVLRKLADTNFQRGFEACRRAAAKVADDYSSNRPTDEHQRTCSRIAIKIRALTPNTDPQDDPTRQCNQFAPGWIEHDRCEKCGVLVDEHPQQEAEPDQFGNTWLTNDGTCDSMGYVLDPSHAPAKGEDEIEERLAHAAQNWNLEDPDERATFTDALARIKSLKEERDAADRQRVVQEAERALLEEMMAEAVQCDDLDWPDCFISWFAKEKRNMDLSDGEG